MKMPKKTKLSSTGSVQVGFAWPERSHRYFRMKFDDEDYQFSLDYAVKLHKWLGEYIKWSKQK